MPMQEVRTPSTRRDVQVRIIRNNDLTWSMNDKPPFILEPFTEFDPFPCYAHDRDLVARQARAVYDAWLPETNVTWILPYLEDLGRTNGSADRDILKWDKDRSSPSEWDSFITLSGKRIPPHPAVTRYLVGHEYGHHVKYWIARARGQDEEELLAEYAGLRGLENVRGTGGNWHRSPNEVFACDFRMLIAKTEIEFWPHMGVTRPEAERKVIDWWDEAWWEHQDRITTSNR